MSKEREKEEVVGSEKRRKWELKKEKEEYGKEKMGKRRIKEEKEELRKRKKTNANEIKTLIKERKR